VSRTSFDNWIHLLHIVASMVWVGGVITLSALAFHVRRDADPEATARFIGSLRVIGPIVFAPAPLVLLVTGIWSVSRKDAWSFSQTWVWLSLALLGAAFLYGAAFQSRTAIRAERAAAAKRGAEARRLLGRWTLGSLLTLVLLLVATWDMVAKPGL
jgi:uncharacterized membrane protein